MRFMKTKQAAVLLMVNILAGMSLANAANPPPPARAHFTLRIPLEISNLHESVREISIQCYIFNSTFNSIAAAEKRVPVNQATGNPTESVVVVTLNAHAGKDPRDGTSYRCHVDMVRGQDSRPTSFGGWGRTSWGNLAELEADTGKPFRQQVTGTLVK